MFNFFEKMLFLLPFASQLDDISEKIQEKIIYAWDPKMLHNVSIEDHQFEISIEKNEKVQLINK